MLPSGWIAKQLRDLGAAGRPVVKAGPFGSSIKKEAFVPSGYKVYGQEQVIARDAFCGDYFVDEQHYKSLLSCAVRPGDILISLVGTVGRTLLVPLNAPAGIINPRLIRISVDLALVDPHFLQIVFDSESVKKTLSNWAQGGTMDVLNAELVKALPIKLPPLSEQRAIATILATWDRAIELTEKLIAAKQKRTCALSQQLVTGVVRFPQFGSNQPGSNSTIATVPAMVWRGIYPPSVRPGIPKIGYQPPGWKKTTMRKLLRIQKRPIELQAESVYQLVVAKRNRGGIEPRERLKGSEIKTPTQFAVHQGDFVISRRQIVHGACGVVPPALNGAIVSNEYAVCQVSHELNIDFLKYLTHTLYFQQTCFQASVGVAIEKMIFQLDRWLDFPFLIPPLAEQEAIVEVLKSADAEVELLQQKLDALRRQKKGLMQQLLTGKVRVKVPAEAPEV